MTTHRKGVHSNPPSFLGWSATERAVEVRSLEFMGANTESQDLAVVITGATQIIFRHSAGHPDDTPCNHSEDEHTILYLGTRVSNAAQAFWCLLLYGYYGPALTVQRDVVESTLLLQRFALRPSDVAIWRQSDVNERLKAFSPSKNRRILDASSEPHLYWRFRAYSELAAHPTPRGRGLTTMDGRYWTGPHFNEKLLAELVRHCALHVLFACDVLCGFDFLGNPDEGPRAKLRELLDNSLGIDGSVDGDVNSPGEK